MLPPPGYRSSEFWLTLASFLLSSYLMLSPLNTLQDAIRCLGSLAASTVLTYHYLSKRNQLKCTALEALAILGHEPEEEEEGEGEDFPE